MLAQPQQGKEFFTPKILLVCVAVGMSTRLCDRYYLVNGSTLTYHKERLLGCYSNVWSPAEYSKNPQGAPIGRAFDRYENCDAPAMILSRVGSGPGVLQRMQHMLPFSVHGRTECHL